MPGIIHRGRSICMLAIASMLLWASGLAPSAARAVAEATTASASSDVVLRAGATNPVNAQAPYEYTKYYPRGADGMSRVKVHRNDVVEWRFPGFHSVTFLPGDTGSGSENHHPAWIRADEAPGSMGPNEAWWVGTGCGRDGQAPCVVRDDQAFVSSGVPIFSSFSFRAQIDRPAGTTVRYHCTVHPGMHGLLDIVTDATVLPAQASLDEQAEREILEDTAKANQLMDTRATRTVSGDGESVTWTVLAGDETADQTVQVMAYLGLHPDGGPLRISPGDKVEFVVKGQDPHTVTFPNETIGHRNIGQLPGPPHGTGGLRATIRCELDGASSGAPGIPFPPAAVSGCPVGAVELTLSPWMVQPHGTNTILTNATYADSAIMVAEDNADFVRTRPTTPPSSWPSTFTVSFPNRGTFTYGCNLHTPFMSSSLKVE